MRRSTVISIALHAAILVWAVAIFPSARLDAPPLLDVPVDIMTPSEFTKLKAGMVDAKDDGPLEKKPEEPKPKAVTEKEAPKPKRTRRFPARKRLRKRRGQAEGRAEARRKKGSGEGREAETGEA